MFRPRLRAPRRIGVVGSPLQRPVQRAIHHVPATRHDVRQGIPNLLSVEGFDIAWTQQMTLMLEKLNALIAGTEFEERDMKSIILATAREPSQAAIFNHASYAHNNDFFFKTIAPRKVEIPSLLRKGLEENFSSIETLRREFVATAAGMFGPGFVWLVKANLPSSGRGADNYRLLTTYLAGSPYPGAHWRRQSVDMNTVGGASPEARASAKEWLERQGKVYTATSGPAPPPQLPAVGGPGAAASLSAAGGGVASADVQRPPGGIDVIPLLCLNTWEHVWLRDYGVGSGGYGGKKTFAEAWWDAIDWDEVAQMANISRPNFKT